MGLTTLLTGSIGKYLLMAGALAALAGWAIHDITGPYKRDVARLEGQIKSYEEAEAQRQKIIAEDEKIADDQEKELMRLREMIKEAKDASPLAADACRLSAEQLLRLRAIAGS